MIPVGIAGLFFKGPIESLFSGNLVFIGSMLVVTSLILALAHFTRKRERKIGYIDAFIIGVAQAVAVIPGISRSGSTIAAGLIIGNSKDEIARFSFLMVLLPVIGANLMELVTKRPEAEGIGAGIILTGFIAAFISGYIACRWMISLVRKSKLIWFSVYCVIIGLISILIG
jgi:undecaprenyl-diphosphatase